MCVDLRSMEYYEVEEVVLNLGEKKYRAKQIYNFLAKGVSSIDEMYTLSKDFREIEIRCSWKGTVYDRE